MRNEVNRAIVVKDTLLLLLMVLLPMSCSHRTDHTETRAETINCTTGTSGDLMEERGLFLVFGYNTDSTRQVCLALKMNQFEAGNYSTADSTFAAGYSFVAYSSKGDLKTTHLFDVISGNFDVSINQTGDTIFSGTMSAIDKKDSTDVPELTITIPLKHVQTE